ncbi:hypothetical protein B0H15DRAFT_952548 [Mycena belliarum]|uniref:MYND-type domain-containing protein n=1 Tax=Mycena belliarum TaxID=1033014 RepID=A0AAD6TXA0_9AGAR|nr:hypothetical protein B0H15DRAFT_952548 [Mycena belliae]
MESIPEALEIGTLRSESLEVQRAALRVMQRCTRDDIADLEALMPKKDPRSKNLLVVSFALLDPTRIPSAGGFSEILEQGDGEAWAVSSCFWGLAYIVSVDELPREAREPLWRRLVEWIRFFSTYWGFLLPALPEERVAVQGVFDSLIWSFVVYPETRTAVHAEDPAVSLMARFWIEGLREGGKDTVLSHQVLALLAGAREGYVYGGPEFPCDQEELVTHLAREIRFWADETPDVAACLAVQAGLRILARCDGAPPGCADLSAREEAVEVIVDAISRVGRHVHDVQEARDAVRVGMVTLKTRFLGPSGEEWLRRAFRRGLLGDLVALLVMQAGRDFRSWTALAVVWGVILPRALSSIHVVGAVRGGMKRAAERLGITGQATPEWESVQALADERFSAVDQLAKRREQRREQGLKKQEACENPRCRELTKLWRCGGCEVVAYCGQACARVGWEGGHREECRQMRQVKGLGRVDARGREFMRAIFLRYLESREFRAIARGKGQAWLRDHPGLHSVTLVSLERHAAHQECVRVVGLEEIEHSPGLNTIRMQQLLGVAGDIRIYGLTLEEKMVLPMWVERSPGAQDGVFF